MEATLKKTLALRIGAPEPAEVEAHLNVEVIFTTVEATLAALRKAAGLASRLSARIKLIVPQVVPFPMPLDSPPVLLDWNERRFRAFAEQSPVSTTVQIILCRDRLDALARTVGPSSIVIIGCRKRWWPTFESRLQRTLHQAGHEVIVAGME